MRFADHSLVQILVVSIALLFGAIEIGRWFGVRARGGRGSVSTLESSILGLLALMIGFTFAVALSRFEARRDGVLNEANAIGATALRARLLPAPHDKEVLRLLKQYVQLRLTLAHDLRSSGETNAALSRSSAIQEALWVQAKEVAAKSTGVVPTGLFVQSLNELIDDHEKRVTALISGVPDIVLIVLYGVATVASAFAGYAAGVEEQRSRGPLYAAITVFIAVIMLIQDLDRPDAGFITASQQPMRDVAASLAGYTE